MDHDDSLYPDALRRAYDYATQNWADVLSPKESRTSDVWWSMSALLGGNLPDAHVDGGIDVLHEMVPHKLYRRAFLDQHQIRFPEGARVLWEDQIFNVAAYRHAERIAVLADTPFYLWHASDRNTTYTFDPARPDFWDRLEDLMAFIKNTLDPPEFRTAQVHMLAHQVSGRILDRLVPMLAVADAATSAMATNRARKLLSRYTSDAVFSALRSKKHQAQAHLLRQDRTDLLKAFYELDLASTVEVTARKVQWEQGRLRLNLEARWGPKPSAPPMVRRTGAGVSLAVGADLARAVPPELFDVTEEVETSSLLIGIRDRNDHVTWPLPLTEQESRFEPTADGALSFLTRGTTHLDILAAALGAPISDGVWDCRFRSEWAGRMRKGAVRHRALSLPALVHGRAAVAYMNDSKGLSVDTAQRLRTLAIDAEPRRGPAGHISAFATPLDNLAVFGESTVDAGMVVAIPDDAVPEDPNDVKRMQSLEELARRGGLAGRAVTHGDGGWFEGSACLPPGNYTLYARRENRVHRTRRTLCVSEDGEVAFG
jgi:hypothetical protein